MKKPRTLLWKLSALSRTRTQLAVAVPPLSPRPGLDTVSTNTRCQGASLQQGNLLLLLLRRRELLLCVENSTVISFSLTPIPFLSWKQSSGARNARLLRSTSIPNTSLSPGRRPEFSTARQRRSPHPTLSRKREASQLVPLPACSSVLIQNASNLKLALLAKQWERATRMGSHYTGTEG